MIYISHLFPDDQMEELIRQSGMGVEKALTFQLQITWIIFLNP
ncbi:MAG: hypothetical protein ACLR5B_05075 [Blautia sp.]